MDENYKLVDMGIGSSYAHSFAYLLALQTITNN
jgi:hypothetical protein